MLFLAPNIVIALKISDINQRILLTNLIVFLSTTSLLMEDVLLHSLTQLSELYDAASRLVKQKLVFSNNCFAFLMALLDGG